MTENISWLKKPAARPSLRGLHLNLPAINSTMTMQSGDGDTLTKFPKRKSCMMFKGRNMINQVPSAKKKPVDAATNPAGFRNRTLKIVDGRNSMLPKAAAVRRSQVPRRPVQKNQSTPIQMSTPFDVPRSILRPPRYQEQRPPSAKKVIFDAPAVEEGTFPLQESTIQDFTHYDLRKTINKVDASTNTEAFESTEKEPINANDTLLALFKEMSGKLDLLLERNNCGCQTPLPRSHPTKTFAQFMEHLDNIQELSENVTPSTQETSDKQTPATEPKVSEDTPKLKGSDCQPSPVICDTDLLEEKKENIPDTHSALIVGSTTEFIVSATPSPVNEENVRRSARLLVTNHVDSPQPITSKLRNFRKRAIPRYLESFELSPKGKVKRTSGKKDSN